jgi:LGFP repeat-containing protein
MGQDFVNGTIFYSPDTGANVVTGQVLEKYKSVGGPDGDLGFPISSEQDGGLAPASRLSAFAAADKPVIFWTPDHGAVIVRGAINAAWDKLGGATGDLGAPVADQTQDGTVVTQRFSGGAISWDSKAEKFSTEPAGLASQLVGLEVPGAEPPQAPPPSAQPAENPENSGLTWTWWWLLAVVPLLLLAGLAAFAVMRGRHRRDQDDMFAVPGQETDGRDYEPASVGEDAQAGAEDTLFGDRYAREGLGSLAAATSTPPDEGLTSEPVNFWGAPAPHDTQTALADGTDRSEVEQENTDAIDTAPTLIVGVTEVSTDADGGGDDEDAVPDDPADAGDEWTDEHADGSDDLSADREPLLPPVVAPVPEPARDPMTDTGRHARIDFDEPLPQGTALHMPYDDPSEIPDGYPVKADTKSGLYWTPESIDYHEAPVEIWFATEEIALTNGFIRGE